MSGESLCIRYNANVNVTYSYVATAYLFNILMVRDTVPCGLCVYGASDYRSIGVICVCERFLSVLCRCVIDLIRGLYNDAISFPHLEHDPKPRIISKSADH
jgi:hypothetical protein